MKKIFSFGILATFLLLVFSQTCFSTAATDRPVDASYSITGEVHLKSTDTLSKTGDTVKLFTPQFKPLDGVDWYLVTSKITPLTGVTDSIGAAIWLIQYDDSLNFLQANPIDTLTDSASKVVKIPVAKYPAKRYGLWMMSTAGTFSGGVKFTRAKLIYGKPAK